jgi:hypothetical protein
MGERDRLVPDRTGISTGDRATPILGYPCGPATAASRQPYGSDWRKLTPSLALDPQRLTLLSRFLSETCKRREASDLPPQLRRAACIRLLAICPALAFAGMNNRPAALRRPRSVALKSEYQIPAARARAATAQSTIANPSRYRAERSRVIGQFP